MARTAEKVESLISENPEIEEALGVVLARTNDGTDEVEWGDVRDEMSSGTWGRLIETGVLEDGTEGFRLADPDAVESAIHNETSGSISPDIDADLDDDEGWSTWDKAAALGSVGLFAGYSLSQVRNAIGSALDIFLGPLDTLLPFYAVIMVLAMLTGLYSTLLQANLMDMEKMSAYQEQMQAIQEKQKKAKERGDDEELKRIREEQMSAMGDQLGMFKAQFRPMVWIMLFTIPVFLWMYWMILDGHIASVEQQIIVPLAGENGWRDGVIGPMQLWIVWYFLCSMAFTQVIRKSLNIQTSPT
ncbi:MAG: DUF106 domain-containing protein [Halobacteriales archaeon]